MKKIIVITFLCLLGGSSNLFAQNNWKLIWSDEFNYKGHPKETKWDYEEGFVRNKEPQYYTKRRKKNARVKGGNLIIEARKENFKEAQYTSASLITLNKKSFKYGRVEVRAKVPKGLGSWPAIWMLGVNRTEVKWPHCGEIDIMEFVGKDSMQVYGTVHYSKDDGKYEYKGLKPKVNEAPYEDFHVYAMEKTIDAIKIFYDDTLVFHFDLNKADQATKRIFEKEFYLLINLALGHERNLGGKLHDSILPLKYYIDYVRIYE